MDACLKKCCVAEGGVTREPMCDECDVLDPVDGVQRYDGDIRERETKPHTWLCCFCAYVMPRDASSQRVLIKALNLIRKDIAAVRATIAEMAGK